MAWLFHVIGLETWSPLIEFHFPSGRSSVIIQLRAGVRSSNRSSSSATRQREHLNIPAIGAAARNNMARVLRLSVLSVSLLVLLTPALYADPQLPQPQGLVSDFAGKVSPAAKQQIETLLRSFRDRTGIEVAVVT